MTSFSLHRRDKNGGSKLSKQLVYAFPVPCTLIRMLRREGAGDGETEKKIQGFKSLTFRVVEKSVAAVIFVDFK